MLILTRKKKRKKYVYIYIDLFLSLHKDYMLCEKEGLSRSEWALLFTCNWQWLTSIELAWTKRQNFKCKFQWLSLLSWFTKYVVWMRRKCGEIEFILGSVTQFVCRIKEIHAPLNSMLASGISQNRRKKKIQRYSISTILLLIQRKKRLSFVFIFIGFYWFHSFSLHLFFLFSIDVRLCSMWRTKTHKFSFTCF